MAIISIKNVSVISWNHGVPFQLFHEITGYFREWVKSLTIRYQKHWTTSKREWKRGRKLEQRNQKSLQNVAKFHPNYLFLNKTLTPNNINCKRSPCLPLGHFKRMTRGIWNCRWIANAAVNGWRDLWLQIDEAVSLSMLRAVFINNASNSELSQGLVTMSRTIVYCVDSDLWRLSRPRFSNFTRWQVMLKLLIWLSGCWKSRSWMKSSGRSCDWANWLFRGPFYGASNFSLRQSRWRWAN